MRSRTWRTPSTVIARLMVEIFPSCPKAGLLATRSRRAVSAASLLISSPMSVDAPDDLGLYLCEREVMGFDHGAVGAALARNWGLPHSLRECI
ncbi:MAG TPA: HDOD domain-containing protein, partial [Steroidobacteraceae bacterium]|nr:HDOD domain-containing protein [Steroidobacteraceae bacterium]